MLIDTPLHFAGIGMARNRPVGLTTFCISTALLHHMGQFMGQKLLACGISRVILPLPKVDVLSDGEGSCLHGVVEGVRLGVVMNSDSAEIGPKGALHRGAQAFR